VTHNGHSSLPLMSQTVLAKMD